MQWQWNWCWKRSKYFHICLVYFIEESQLINLRFVETINWMAWLVRSEFSINKADPISPTHYPWRGEGSTENLFLSSLKRWEDEDENFLDLKRSSPFFCSVPVLRRFPRRFMNKFSILIDLILQKHPQFILCNQRIKFHKSI